MSPYAQLYLLIALIRLLVCFSLTLYLYQGGYSMPGACLFVCLSV